MSADDKLDTMFQAGATYKVLDDTAIASGIKLTSTDGTFKCCGVDAAGAPYSYDCSCDGVEAFPFPFHPVYTSSLAKGHVVRVD